MLIHSLTVLSYQWREDAPKQRREFLPAHVNTQARAIRRHLAHPHRYVCISDERAGFDDGVTVLPTPPAALDVGRYRNPEGVRFPSCYRRLWTFSEEARALGEWILLLDIDAVPVAPLDPLLDFSRDFTGVRPFLRWGVEVRLAGGMYLLRAGAHTEVWTRFEGQASIAEARRAGFRGSDQAWISYCLAAKVAVWGRDSGLYSIRDIANGKQPLPQDARLVQFNGTVKPWQSDLGWVREHWR